MNVLSNGEACARSRYRARYKIREVLDAHDMSQAELARRIGVSGAVVCATIRGRKHSPRVLDALRELGVPEKYICDPRGARAEVA